MTVQITFYLTTIRLDIELAMQNGTPTLFRGDEVPIHSVLCDPDVSIGQFRRAAFWMPPMMLDLFRFSKLLNEVERRSKPKLDPLDYTETLLSLLYRLVDVSPLREAPTKLGGPYKHLTYLAMISFMTTMLPEYTRDGATFSLLADGLESAMQDLCPTASESSEYNSPLILWTLFISGISVLNLKDHYWLSPLIADYCTRLGLENWAAIQRQLSWFPWIFSLHEDQGRRLWEHVQLGSREVSWDISSRTSS
jgi:hypothetical protein